MTTTPTTNINATLQQIAELTASGCDIVRVAVPSRDDAEALPIIAKKSQIPVIADIHFQPNYVYAAIDAGCAAVRVNPGNIRKFDDQVGKIAAYAKAAGVSLRIGVNAGSLEPSLLQKYGKPTAEALVESAVWEASLFEEHDFHDFKISVKHNDPIVMVKAYRQAPPSRAPSSPRPRSESCSRRGSATRSASRCRRRLPRRSRSACRSCSRSTCASASSRSCRARAAGGRRSTSTRSPTA